MRLNLCCTRLAWRMTHDVVHLTTNRDKEKEKRKEKGNKKKKKKKKRIGRLRRLNIKL